MNIAIDTTPLKTEHKYRGIGFYTANLIRALEKYEKQNKYTKFVRTQNLPKNVDLVHYPYLDLFAKTLKVYKDIRTVVTIHDLIPIRFPEHFPAGIKGTINWWFQKRTLQNVYAVIADSYCSRKDIHDLVGIAKEKIHVVHLAPSEKFKKLEIGNWKLEMRQKYQLPDIFVLYVGDVNWNKNVVELVKAFAEIKTEKEKVKTTTKNLKLVLVGKAFLEGGVRETREINELIERLHLQDKIMRLGFVPTDDLVGIYNLATVYVQPSFYEGFGLPCLEAMTCGCPVIAANTSSLPEILGKAAIFVNPYKTKEITEGIMRILIYHTTEYGKYQELVEKGLRWVKRFSWRKVAKETVEIYKSVVRG